MKVSVTILGLFSVSVNLSAPTVFRGCDHSYTLNRGRFWIESPYFPKKYPVSTACRYKVTAPLDHQVQVHCWISLPKNGTYCTTELLYLANEGNMDLQGAHRICGKGTAYTESTFRFFVLAYVSNGGSGKFRCEFKAVKQPCDCGWSASAKIQNGQETDVNAYPSMVGLRDTTIKYSSAVFCGGAILSHLWIVTVAHCIDMQPAKSKLEAIIGAHNLSKIKETRYAARYRIVQVIQHEKYKSKSVVKNDIALLRTATTMEWSRGVGPICLPYTAKDLYVKKYADVLGWGTTFFGGPTAPALRKVTLRIIPNKCCQAAYQMVAKILPIHLCTFDEKGVNRTSCAFDSGGPVILVGKRRQVLVGLTSFGNDCMQKGYVTGVNTRISSYLSWIKQHATGLCPVKL